MLTDIELTVEQRGAKEVILEWLNAPGKQIFRLGGYAGTGKTTLVKQILSTVKVPFMVSAFTGKAVSVLRKKGVHAKTLHSLMYDPQEEKDGSVTFVKKMALDEEFIIVDEASMLSTDLNNDLLGFGAKLLYIGDPGQLEPVGDNPNLMKDCDIVLSKIHRQAADSPILSLATNVRNGGKINHYNAESRESSVVVTNKEAALQQADEVDQVICGYNDTRRTINGLIRKHLNHKGELVEGEKLICLRNNARKGLFNGMIVHIEKIRKVWSDCYVVDIKDELGSRLCNIKLNLRCLQEGEWKQSNGRVPFEHCLFTYGYCITCHKSQGSEWDSVLVFDQSNSRLWSADRWRYTAITRAAKRLIYGI